MKVMNSNNDNESMYNTKLGKVKDEDIVTLIIRNDEICEDYQKTKIGNSDESANRSENNEISDALNQLFSTPKVSRSYNVDLSIRKDVVNKNLMRIISRYFKDILTSYFPDFKTTFKSAQKLDELLGNFLRIILPTNTDENLKYILGAFVLAPKMKILNMTEETRKIVSQVHKTLSKYTHKDLEKLYKMPSVKLIMSYFNSSSGIAYFSNEDVVQKHEGVYFKALQTFLSKFKLPHRDQLSFSL